MQDWDNDNTATAPVRNNGRLLDLQHCTPSVDGEVMLTYFGHSAFRITTPSGLTVMIDPWRNDPAGGGGGSFFFGGFPDVSVDLCVSTHAHFDHDAVRDLDSSIVIERPVGTFSIADLTLKGIADKHATDFAHGNYDIGEILQRTRGIDVRPPDNPRSWDNSLVIVETGGMRLLHWGDNRPAPDPRCLPEIEGVDILILPVDDSQHVLSFDSVGQILEMVAPKLVIPCHYYIPAMTQRYSTLLPVSGWLSRQTYPILPDGPSVALRAVMAEERGRVLCFGDNLARA